VTRLGSIGLGALRAPMAGNLAAASGADALVVMATDARGDGS
jgi:3-hydroxyisobutyrate dehydrogenase-like beta-hydroxyacid dehydrogenase